MTKTNEWHRPYPESSPAYWEGPNNAYIDPDADTTVILWDEGADDYYSTATRSIAIPTAVLRAALSAVSGGDE
ncbi:MAG TPA: hypothetical protein VMW48_02395 [Vicinamibacterales bacterium]|nr:hypothetical protein [Vicinamibacterales bacterium]